MAAAGAGDAAGGAAVAAAVAVPPREAAAGAVHDDATGGERGDFLAPDHMPKKGWPGPGCTGGGANNVPAGFQGNRAIGGADSHHPENERASLPQSWETFPSGDGAASGGESSRRLPESAAAGGRRDKVTCQDVPPRVLLDTREGSAHAETVHAATVPRVAVGGGHWNTWAKQRASETAPPATQRNFLATEGDESGHSHQTTHCAAVVDCLAAAAALVPNTPWKRFGGDVCYPEEGRGALHDCRAVLKPAKKFLPRRLDWDFLVDQHGRRKT